MPVAIPGVIASGYVSANAAGVRLFPLLYWVPKKLSLADASRPAQGHTVIQVMELFLRNIWLGGILKIDATIQIILSINNTEQGESRFVKDGAIRLLSSLRIWATNRLHNIPLIEGIITETTNRETVGGLRRVSSPITHETMLSSLLTETPKPLNNGSYHVGY